MSVYLDKKYVNSFPSSKRASVNKLMTENSVTRLINRLIDVTGYVITNSLDDNSPVNDIPIESWLGLSEFEFVIMGYYFSIIVPGSGTDAEQANNSGLMYLLNKTGFRNFTPGEEHTLYARIFIDRTDKNFPEVYGQDTDESEYRGIIFYQGDEAPPLPPDGAGMTDYDYYDLILVQYKMQENGNYSYVVPLDSLFKFNSKSIANIDGGEISL